MARRLIVGVLVLAGAWQIGEAAWIHVKARLAQHLLQRAWARTATADSRIKPWPWADTWPVARLHVPAHGIDLVVLHDVSGRTLAFGPGHAPASAAPATSGTAIVSGHRDTHFRFLARMQPGDEIVVDAAGGRRERYRVREIAVVDSRLAALRNAADEGRLVLVTCYPFDAVTPGGPLRWVVAAVRADD